ncbi:MAG: hypothetical protein MUC94_16360 [bacterium]|jgi:hypothetical protein|nr:hypothetical protein [bacterium]
MKKKGKPTTAQRREYVMSQRDAGLSYEQIAADTIKKFGKANLPKGYDKRLANLDVQRELSKNSRKTLETDIRRNRILHYRMAGMTFQQIVEKLEAEFGKQGLPANYNERLVCRDLSRYLEKIEKEHKQEISKNRSVNRERLHFLLNRLWEKAAEGDYQAIDRSLKIIDAIAKLDAMDGALASSASASDKIGNSFAELSDYFADNHSQEVDHEKNSI